PRLPSFPTRRSSDLQNSVVIGTPLIRDREARGALRNRAVANHLHGTDANPLVTKTGANARIDHRIDVAVVNEAVGAIEQVAGIRSEEHTSELQSRGH